MSGVIGARTLEIGSSPHIVRGRSVDTIMRNVVWALLPTAAFGVFAFGWAGLLTLATALGSCLLTERVACRLAGRPSTLSDWSVAITGLLYGLTLPPALPLWMVAVGGVFGVAVGKALFGGLGSNPFNPALVGRAFDQAAFPVAMTTWAPAFADERFAAVPASTLTLPFAQPAAAVAAAVDGWSGATPLSAWKFDRQATDAADAALGFVAGSTGETCALLILLGGIYLVARRMMSWRIPVAVLGTVFVLAGALHLAAPATYASPLFHLGAGGLMLGAVFMATDLVASPMTHLGLWLYGGLIGGLVVAIRTWGGMPEGVMYAILLANAVAPLIDRAIQPRVYGTSRRARRAAAGEAS
jgi:Na+-translocating ferredoxin:NAD+ oxidoreductase subunit D